MIAIGWDDLGGLRNYESRDDVSAALRALHPDRPRPMNDSLACHQFCRDIRVGDVVFVKQGRDRLFGVGVGEGDYEHRPHRAEYHHVRPVRWEAEGDRAVPGGAWLPIKTLTEVTG